MPVKPDPNQEKAASLSVCGKSKYAEMLQSLGYSEKTAQAVTSLFAEIDWQKQFETGKGPGPRVAGNYEKGKPASNLIPKKTKQNNNPKQDEPEMLSGPALPKGPGDPMSGSSKEVFGLRALG